MGRSRYGARSNQQNGPGVKGSEGQSRPPVAITLGTGSIVRLARAAGSLSFRGSRFPLALITCAGGSQFFFGEQQITLRQCINSGLGTGVRLGLRALRGSYCELAKLPRPGLVVDHDRMTPGRAIWFPRFRCGLSRSTPYRLATRQQAPTSNTQCKRLTWTALFKFTRSAGGRSLVAQNRGIATVREARGFRLSPPLSYRRCVSRRRRVGAVKRVWTARATDTTDCCKTLVETHETTILRASHAAPRIVGAPRINDCGAGPVGSRPKCHDEYNRQACGAQRCHGHSPHCFPPLTRQFGERSRGSIC